MTKKTEQSDTSTVETTVVFPPLNPDEIRIPTLAVIAPPEIKGTSVGEVYEVLATEVGAGGLLDLLVVVSHDNLLAGETIRVPLSIRVAGLVERGFLEVVSEGWN